MVQVWLQEAAGYLEGSQAVTLLLQYQLTFGIWFTLALLGHKNSQTPDLI